MTVRSERSGNWSRDTVDFFLDLISRAHFTLATAVTAALLVGCASTPSNLPPSFLSYWQRGNNGVGVAGVPTSYYVKLFSERGLCGDLHPGSEKDFYHACLGDPVAFHRFLHSPDGSVLGAPGEWWTADMVVLILRYGDAGLYGLLLKEKQPARESVGIVLESQLKKEDIARYRKTRTLYKYRFTRGERLRSHGLL
jgi:hypothetical protein